MSKGERAGAKLEEMAEHEASDLVGDKEVLGKRRICREDCLSDGEDAWWCSS